MKKFNYKYHLICPLLVFVGVVMISCERGFSDDVDIATFPLTPEIFTDAPVGLTDEFFESFDPNAGANPTGFGTDENIAYEGTTSIRIDVPAPSDPDGNFIGGIFRDRGDGRNLTQYNALSFWAQGSVNGTVLVGFGTDFEESRYAVSTTVQMTTGWKKYIVPIPDASKLVQEKGMFLFSAGGFDVFGDGPNGNEVAWTFWIDELRFENIGTLGQPRPAILGGQDQSAQANLDTTVQISGLSYTVNQANGEDVTVITSPSYFDFETSNPFVASVDEFGIVSIDGPGEDGNNRATITATLGGLQASGSLTVEASNLQVISIYSDIFANVGNLNLGAFNNPEIQIVEENIDGNNVVTFSSLNFVGLAWDGTIDASEMTHIHLDVRLNSAPDTTLFVELLDVGPNGTNDGFDGTDDTAGGFDASDQLVQGEWVEIDIPLTAFTLPTGGGGSGSPNLSNIANFILVSNSGSVTVDNIYFYAEN